VTQPTSLHRVAPYARRVMFSQELRERVGAGEITVSIRLWQRPKVKTGGRYASHGFEIEVDSVELLPFAAITAADVARSGEPDRETLRRRAAHAGPIEDHTLVYRIEFHVVQTKRILRDQ
jgi:hypothetical protein